MKILFLHSLLSRAICFSKPMFVISFLTPFIQVFFGLLRLLKSPWSQHSTLFTRESFSQRCICQNQHSRFSLILSLTSATLTFLQIPSFEFYHIYILPNIDLNKGISATPIFLIWSLLDAWNSDPYWNEKRNPYGEKKGRNVLP